MSEKSQPSPSRSKYFHGPLYRRMSDDLHLVGMSRRTHDGYLRAVRQLADYVRRSPDQISEDQLRLFFLHLRNEKKFATGSLRVAFSGIKFYAMPTGFDGPTDRQTTETCETCSHTEARKGLLHAALPARVADARAHEGAEREVAAGRHHGRAGAADH